ncbi:oligosaccharyl transferase stt3 subunit [Coemansia sp. RSA 1813]|nr:oligosaccharyl transferase stt3 subunit [Coemansia sp. RSA 1646]KAJ1772222.1 oligosaccharyl transferase stt3 subunit [Coemansia sp. RSA 1843]KAJ2091854.1 oligosaccharyl transferase stt3 subunit [Coemansia sp. RSA 986]KAJ2215819.1 oligosaccharyl transferase stt3 subunit [Coemansia sp. RSA 487]KAJ2571750.1 oligosaccharyl transferase stt3 subunit [Coemansia sp. RSA 1813]
MANKVLGLTAVDQTSLLRIAILGLISIVAIGSRLYSVIRFESVIHEFDPWFNYRTTRYLVDNGFDKFWNWFDETAWYPLGRVVGGTLYPGIMVTSATIYNALHMLNIPVDVRNVCVFLAPVFSALTAIATYKLGKEVKNATAGLLAAAFMGVAPGYISRSVAGSYDNEGIAIFLLVFTFFLWLRSVRLGSATYGALTAVFYFYMVSAWGGYVFIINLIPLHVFTLLAMGRYTSRLYVAYSTFYVIGTLASMQIPFVGFQPTFTSEHMAALGTFGLIQIVAFASFVRTQLPEQQFQTLLRGSVLVLFVAGVGGLVLLTMTGVIAPWTGRFYSLWDTGYAKIHIPIIASVSEHQPTAWPNFFFDLNMLIWLFPAGIYFSFRQLTDHHVFLILYSLFASYFAGVMVRLMLTLTPIVCVMAGISMANIFESFLDVSTLGAEPDAASEPKNKKKQASAPSATSDGDANPEASAPAEHKGGNKKGGGGKKAKGAANKAASKPTTSSASTKGDGHDSNASLPLSLSLSPTATKQEKAAQSLISKKTHALYPKFVVMAVFLYFLCIFQQHCSWVTSSAYSSPSVVLSSRSQDGSMHIIDDFREAYYWLRKNTAPDAKVLSWWDYGYQLAGMADRVTLVDNNTWNNTHIATVGKIMASDEDTAYELARRHDVSYVLVVFGGMLGYSGDDINKFLWMIRIAQGVFPDDVKEAAFFNDQGQYAIGDTASKAMRDSLMHKLSYYRFGEVMGARAFDRVRKQQLPSSVTLDNFEEAYTTENWMVRIYKVKDLDNLGRDHHAVAALEERKRPAFSF